VPISFACPCGRELRVSDDDAGLPVVCPVCQCDVTAPGALVRPWAKRERGALLDDANVDARSEVTRERGTRTRERGVYTFENVENHIYMGGGVVAMLIGAIWVLFERAEWRIGAITCTLGAGVFCFGYLCSKFKRNQL
jgi:hypothetical protein